MGMEDDPITQNFEMPHSQWAREWADLMDTDWYRMIMAIAITVQAAMFVSFGIASIYAFFTDNALLAIFLALLAVMLKPTGK